MQGAQAQIARNAEGVRFKSKSTHAQEGNWSQVRVHENRLLVMESSWLAFTWQLASLRLGPERLDIVHLWEASTLCACVRRCCRRNQRQVLASLGQQMGGARGELKEIATQLHASEDPGRRDANRRPIRAQ